MFSLLGSLALFCAPSRASAQPRRPSLHWTRSARAQSCIDARALAARVEALTGPVLVRPSESDYVIEGHVDLTGARFVVRVTVSGADGVPTGERLLEQQSRDCRTLDAAIAFVVALTIDPDLELESMLPPVLEGPAAEEALLAEVSAAPPPMPTVAPEPARKPSDSPPPTPIAAEARESPATTELRSALLVTSRELPAPAMGLLVALQHQLWRWFGVELQARAAAALWPHALGMGHRLRAQSFGLALFPCGRQTRASFALEECLGVEPLLVRARGIGFDRPDTARLVSWGGAARLAIELAWRERWTVRTGVQLRVAGPDKQLVYSDDAETQPAYSLRRVSVALSLGIGRRFISGNRALAGTNGPRRGEAVP